MYRNIWAGDKSRGGTKKRGNMKKNMSSLTGGNIYEQPTSWEVADSSESQPASHTVCTHIAIIIIMIIDDHQMIRWWSSDDHQPASNTVCTYITTMRGLLRKLLRETLDNVTFHPPSNIYIYVKKSSKHASDLFATGLIVYCVSMWNTFISGGRSIEAVIFSLMDSEFQTTVSQWEILTFNFKQWLWGGLAEGIMFQSDFND